MVKISVDLLAMENRLQSIDDGVCGLPEIKKLMSDKVKGGRKHITRKMF